MGGFSKDEIRGGFKLVRKECVLAGELRAQTESLGITEYVDPRLDGMMVKQDVLVHFLLL